MVHNGVRREKVPRMERKGVHKCSAGGCRNVPCVVHNGVRRCRAWSARVHINAVREGATWCVGVQESSVYGTQRCEKVPRVERKGTGKCSAGGCSTWCVGVQESAVWYTTVRRCWTFL